MFSTLVSGVLIGIANIIPGVSGATMAVITNHYGRLIQQLAYLSSWQFSKVQYGYLVSIMGAALVGILCFARPLHYGMAQAPSMMLLCISGLVMGSLPLVSLASQPMPFRSRYLNGWFALGILVIVMMLWVNTTVGVSLPGTMLPLFVSGVLATVAMLIPGVSGAMMLVMLGTYDQVLLCIDQQTLWPLWPMVVGAGVGLITTSSMIRWAIHHHAKQCEPLILGLLVGSVGYIAWDINWSAIQGMVGLLLLCASWGVSRALVAYGQR
tara:strand:- start:728 stop:1528 length:801 start_codon:yes stop_codon:yes gene_type:complete